MKKHFIPLVLIVSIIAFIPSSIFAQKWMKVSAGGRFSAALRSDGTIWECGRAAQGQLGNGADTTQVYNFAQTGTDTDWVDISCGEDHILALKRNGSLWAWGNNGNGELGVGDSISRKYPEQINSDFDWVYISASSYASYAIKKDGSIWGWGLNFDGNLGDSNRVNQAVPVKIDGTYKWRKICAGKPFSMALRADGTLWASGFNGDGDLGNGTLKNSLVLVQVNTDNDWIDISSGWNFTIALKKNGTIWSWGYNGNGQLGQGNISPLSKPKMISSDSDWVRISTGCLYGYGIKRNGTLWAWGSNYIGELGDGTTNQYDFPKMIGSENDWRMVSGAKGYSISSNVLRGLFSLGIRGDSSTLCVTGENDYGQLGIGSFMNIHQYDCDIYAGIPDIKTSINDHIRIFPNPANETVNISIPVNNQIEGRICISDMNGKQVYFNNIMLTNNLMPIDISALPQGVYLLEIFSKDQVFRTKLVKE